MEDFLKDGMTSKDILVSIEIPKVEYSIIKMFKHNYTDFSMVNICVVSSDEIRIAVGARPGRSVLIENLSNAHTAEELLLNIEFGSDFRGSGEYRRKVAETMLSEILEEGLLWK
jgi:CO/xanthine dehydrogenase FAD-binding subunit